MGLQDKDVIRWLLEDDNPSVKYLTLRLLLDYPEDDWRVVAAQRQIMEQGPVPKILAQLREDGHYEDHDTIQKYGADWASFGYLPKYKATVWQLILFAELGADGADPRVRATCEYVLQHSWQPDGLFSMVGNQYLAPCFQGNMLYALARLGYQNDPRLVKAYDVLLSYTRFDDGDFDTPKTWPYRGQQDRCCSSHSCYAGCLKSLRAVSALAPERWDYRVYDFVRRGAEFFLAHQVFHSSHNPKKLLHRDIDKITFPSFIYGDFLEILTALLQLGIKDERMEKAVALLNSKQLSNGRWKLERDVTTMHVPLGRKHHESKWATFRARYALKLWDTRN